MAWLGLALVVIGLCWVTSEAWLLRLDLAIAERDLKSWSTTYYAMVERMQPKTARHPKTGRWQKGRRG